MKTRTFLITGASKGIGRALAERLVGAGHQVVGLARGTDSSFPGELVSVDLADLRETEGVLRDLTSSRRFDGLVNNVGLVRPQRIGEVRMEDFDAVMAVNLHPAVQAMQALLPGMREAGWGRVVNISSLTVLGAFDRTAYAAAKSALISFSRSWALELATTGITVNTVAPGPTETELFRKNSPPGSLSEKKFLSFVPMNRFGKPDEIAAAIEFLLSEDAGFMTGQTLYVDGGASVGRTLV
ncbi:SDR family oxidoreductase [Cupriavidus necator]|uniref:SDR family oxidoreductase n=1 Tax=Cupriavidus necator TaxID=106590 RepID=UPI0005B3ECDC|nr:SDR family oxidoreductase [Cupriavidus necator]